MAVEMKQIKRTRTNKKKIMLWVDLVDVQYLEGLEPKGITVQSKVRQIISAFRLDAQDFGEL